VHVTTLEAETALARELELLTHVRDSPDAQVLWLWQSPQSLVAPRKMAKLEGFEATTDALARAGWPVSLRATGGDVTPQGPGIVNVTHVYATRHGHGFDIEGAYDRLCQPIEAALGDGASRGWQPGAFCDGAHNVQFNGLKFAGTAMRFKRCSMDKGRQAILAHALMLIAPPAPAAITALNRFLSGVQEPRQIDLAAHTGLPEGMDQDTFLARLADGFRAQPHITPLEVLS
jgi:lipoate-protein ligase A